MKEDPSGYARDLVAALEREQCRIGGQLHDQLCQTLSGSTLLLETIGRAVAAGKTVPPESFARLKSAIETAVTQARALSQGFNPVKLEGAGLMTALHKLATDTPNCEFRCEEPVFVADPESALALYRIAQEALQESVAQPGSKRIQVALEQKDGQVILSIQGEGAGFIKPSENSSWSAMDTMQMRARAARGTLEVKAGRESGATIICKVPL
jgi:two-component system, NarL family, sensor kinase